VKARVGSPAMRLLVLGGTSFVGRHIVEAAVAAGHEVTLFNRGKTNPGLFDQLEQRHGDRQTGDYASLADGQWDGLIDVNAYFPRAVREAAAALEGRVGHATFISTCSVYANTARGPIDEDHEVAELADPTTEEVTNETYGALKAACEWQAAESFGAAGVPVTVIRPGIVAGPHDPTDRFTYWVRRAARGGQVLAVRPDQPVQVVHARDQADFVVKATVEGLAGTFNTTGPSEPLDTAGLIAACADAAGADVEAVWVDEAFMKEHQAYVPLYLPTAIERDGLFQCSSARAEAQGFRNRPIRDTAADTLGWDRTRDDPKGDLPGAPTADDEAKLLQEWRAAVG
jgi:2'-hydroxyisoflavone reductase